MPNYLDATFAMQTFLQNFDVEKVNEESQTKHRMGQRSLKMKHLISSASTIESAE